ncbi:MAG: ATP cone domain-containing protein, partial [Bacteroidota bacterium]
MWNPTSDLVRDLDLKRAALLPPADRPALDAGALVGDLAVEADRLLFVREDGTDARLDPVRLAAPVAEAAATARLAARQSAEAAALAPLVRRVVADVLTRLAALPADARPSFADVVALAEAELLAAGAVDVAKALVMHRAQEVAPAVPVPAAGALQLIRRGGQVVAWNAAKIETAVRKAFLSRGLDSAPAEGVAQRVTDRAAALGLSYVPIATGQDPVQEDLLLAGHARVAEAYITYRAERAVYRATQESAETDQAALIEITEADRRDPDPLAELLAVPQRRGAVGLGDLDECGLVGLGGLLGSSVDGPLGAVGDVGLGHARVAG